MTGQENVVLAKGGRGSENKRKTLRLHSSPRESLSLSLPLSLSLSLALSAKARGKLDVARLRHDDHERKRHLPEPLRNPSRLSLEGREGGRGAQEISYPESAAFILWVILSYFGGGVVH